MTDDIPDRKDRAPKFTRGTGMAPCPECDTLSEHDRGRVYDCPDCGEWLKEAP